MAKERKPLGYVPLYSQHGGREDHSVTMKITPDVFARLDAAARLADVPRAVLAKKILEEGLNGIANQS